MTIFSKNFGGMAPFTPLTTPMKWGASDHLQNFHFALFVCSFRERVVESQVSRIQSCLKYFRAPDRVKLQKRLNQWIVTSNHAN